LTHPGFDGSCVEHDELTGIGDCIGGVAVKIAGTADFRQIKYTAARIAGHIKAGTFASQIIGRTGHRA
jgi:hypothetical protein